MKLHNKKIVILLMLFVIGVANVCASTTPKISIMINGKSSEQSADRGMAYITPNTNRVMIPTRIVAEDMGFKVDWNQSTKKVTVSNGKDTIVLTLNSKYVTVNGVQKTLDAATELKNNRIYIPVRAVSEALGAQVEWIGGTAQLVNITTGAGTTTPSTPSTTVTYDNMVPGKQYPISEVISNVNDASTTLKLIAEISSKGNPDTIKVIKGDTITSINYETGKPLNIKVNAVGWANDRKMSAALSVSNLEANNLRIFYLQNGKIIGHDFAPVNMKETFNGKNYYLFGDGLAGTPECLAKATHLAIAAAYTGEMIIIENPTPTPILNIYSK